jgi:hypothetical protein
MARKCSATNDAAALKDLSPRKKIAKTKQFCKARDHQPDTMHRFYEDVMSQDIQSTNENIEEVVILPESDDEDFALPVPQETPSKPNDDQANQPAKKKAKKSKVLITECSVDMPTCKKPKKSKIKVVCQ